MSTTAEAAIRAAALAAFAADDLLTETGAVDKPKLREKMFAVLEAAKVLNWTERRTRPITRGAMVTAVLPSLPGPETFAECDNPELAEEVWGAVDKQLWGETAARSTLQHLVALNMGNGYVLCRTHIGKDQLSASYITDDLRCIEEDFIRPSSQAAARTVSNHRAILEMLIQRQPAHAKRFLRSFDTHMKAITTTGHEQLTLAIAAVSTEPGDDGGDED